VVSVAHAGFLIDCSYRPQMSADEKEQALLAALRSHGAGLRPIARVYAGADGETDDLYPEIVLQAWKSLGSFRGDSAAGTSRSCVTQSRA
jgi:DNA-directed RNA polymerase specialized sigma24 family protein